MPRFCLNCIMMMRKGNLEQVVNEMVLNERDGFADISAGIVITALCHHRSIHDGSSGRWVSG